MRELTMVELEEVSGAGMADSLKYWGAAAALGQITFGGTWGTIAALTAFGLSPVAATAMIGLAFAGGYVYLND